MFEIPITNRTMNLADCADKWFFDEKHRVWCLEDILYTDKATTPKFQRLSIFVPEEYMRAGGQIVPNGEHNGWTAATAPVIFENNSAGYMQMPHVWLDGPRCYAHPYLKQGYNTNLNLKCSHPRVPFPLCRCFTSVNDAWHRLPPFSLGRT